MKVKTHKMVAKRFKVTKKGKILKRYAGQDHFNTRDSGKITRKKRRDIKVSKAYDKTVKILIGTGAAK
jgi:ribosomal protein L35